MSATKPTACPLDCPDACGVLVETDDRGRFVRVRGNPEHGWSRGTLCGKTALYGELVSSPSRLTKPLVREGRALVSLGLLATLTVDERFHVGDLATSLPSTLRVTAIVLGPSWSRARKSGAGLSPALTRNRRRAYSVASARATSHPLGRWSALLRSDDRRDRGYSSASRTGAVSATSGTGHPGRSIRRTRPRYP